MVGLPVAVFLHNRFFGLLLFSLPRRSHQVRLPLSWLAPAIYQERLSFFGSAYISLRHHGTYTPRALCSAQLAGGCILITFMSSDIPARFIAPTPADSAKPLEPTTTLSSALLLLPPSLFFGPTFFSRVPRSHFPSFCWPWLHCRTRFSIRLLKSCVFSEYVLLRIQKDHIFIQLYVGIPVTKVWCS